MAGGELVTEAVASRSEASLVERLPEVQCSPAGDSRRESRAPRQRSQVLRWPNIGEALAPS